jgi:hypothetical protein
MISVAEVVTRMKPQITKEEVADLRSTGKF